MSSLSCSAVLLRTGQEIFSMEDPQLYNQPEMSAESTLHLAITHREAFIVRQLCNLAAPPPTGFHVGFFPIKLTRSSAAPSRVIAFVPD